jgi:hypothetical protein
LGTIHVSGRARSFEIPDMEHQSGLRLGEDAILLGHDVDPTVQAGDILELILYWQCVGQMDESYTVFTHLLDQNEVIWGQQDSIPAGGEAPTTSWTEGEVIADRYQIMVDPQTPPGAYALEIGMYDAITGQRLPVHGMLGESLGRRILLAGKVEVIPG